ncbi:ATPase synthesis protein 25 mitochondrial [Diaporthe australafricana]|uniref:ATPase synthesis protein 25 n=1 Tax=Diaporthe australafricana TaxID=127596 RepID=A0ABR3WIM2_9PEZI
MALRPILRASAASCSACRASKLGSYISPFSSAISAGPQWSSLSSPALRSQATSATALATQTRFFSSNKAVDEADFNSHSAGAAKENGRRAQQTQDGDGQEEEPWFLQEEPPRHPSLVQHNQPLPKVPDNVPLILHDLVTYAAEDMGLDDLNLLDLRTLDPPAALGPRLIMLFGSARSERHLHVSGSHLMSWLRRKGIQAHADGLLGRNELKVKMRRKQRKAKLLGTAATPMGRDDGVTTRWICMNLGTIVSGSQEPIEFETETGFGTTQVGTTIVVQMLTESKRKELDLELLWSRILARRGDENLIVDDLEYAEADTHPNEMSIFTEGGSPKVFATPSQRRFFSTSSRRPNQVTDPPTSDSIINNVNTTLDPATFIATKVAELERLQAQFTGFPYEDALQALEYSNSEQPPTYTTAWNKAIQYLRPEHSWQFRLWLCVVGRQLGVRRFDLNHLRELAHEMELLGIICNRDHYIEMLEVVYLEPTDSTVSLSEQSKLALDVLNVMYERGEPIVTTDVIVSLIESLARTESQSKQASELQAVLEKFLLQADLPYMGEDALMRLLNAYAAQDNWTRFWEVWRMPPRFQQSRSRELYLHLWTTVASTNHQKRCQEAIRWCFHEMLNENPPVNPVTEVKNALEMCLKVADPGAEEIARHLVVKDYDTRMLSLYEFVMIYRLLNPEWAVQSV